MVPKWLAQFGESFPEALKRRGLLRELRERGPLQGGSGESGQAALGMVAGAGGPGGPGGGAVFREFVIEAVLPPTGPKILEPFAGVAGSGLVEGG